MLGPQSQIWPLAVGCARHHHGLRWQPKPLRLVWPQWQHGLQTSTWPQEPTQTTISIKPSVATRGMDINTNPSYNGTMDPDLAFSGITGLNIKWPQVAALATHISLFLTALTSQSLLLSTVHELLCFSFSPVSPPHACSSWLHLPARLLGTSQAQGCFLPAQPLGAGPHDILMTKSPLIKSLLTTVPFIYSCTSPNPKCSPTTLPPNLNYPIRNLNLLLAGLLSLPLETAHDSMKLFSLASVQLWWSQSLIKPYN